MALPNLPEHDDPFYEDLVGRGEHIELDPDARLEHVGYMVSEIQELGYDTTYDYVDPDTNTVEKRPLHELLNPKRDYKRAIIVGSVAATAISGAAAAVLWQRARFVRSKKNG